MYVGYAADSKEAQLNHILTQCRARLQPLKTLAWSGLGVGVPVLRMMYITTIRSVIEYASPVLSCLGEGRLEKLEKLQNEAMRVILNCPPNAMICAMRMELSLETIKHRVELANLISAFRHVRSGSGDTLAVTLKDNVNKRRVSRTQGRQGYLTSLAEKVQRYSVLSWCVTPHTIEKPPPWEEELPNISIVSLTKKKSMYDVKELKQIVEKKVEKICDKEVAHVFCDGSVAENGRAGCGVVIIDKDGEKQVESEHCYRISNNVSSTMAELCAILYGLREIRGGEGDVCFFVDSRSALESLASVNPVCNEIVDQCKDILYHLRKKNRRISFMWIPSHIGISNNERADELARMGTEKDNIELECKQSLKQLKSIIKNEQEKEESNKLNSVYNNSETFRHYVKVFQGTNFTYGRQRNAAKDSLCTRLRLGYKYLWQLGVKKNENDICCKLCNEPRCHTLKHYVIDCPNLVHCRHPQIKDIAEQIIWMINNNKIKEMANTCKKISDILR